jgi:hypothetical protein
VTTPPRIAFVHTVSFLVEVFRKACEEHLPGVEVFHILNESLLKDLLRDGPSPRLADRIVRQALIAVDAGADIVVATCSSTSPMMDIARSLSSVPILKVDEPMRRAANRLRLWCRRWPEPTTRSSPASASCTTSLWLKLLPTLQEPAMSSFSRRCR